MFIAAHVLDPLLARPLSQRVLLIPLLLVLVGLVVGLLLDKVVPFARGSGIPEVKTAYVFGPGPQLSLRTVVGKFVLGALSIGSGFSLGREGPTVQICAAIGAAVGKATRRPSRVVKALISVGAAAGIAAAFNTPIAAITFAMEEVIGDLNQRLVGAIVVASVAAAVVERAMLGGRPSLTVPGYSLGDWRELFAYALLGVLAGLAPRCSFAGCCRFVAFVRSLAGLPLWARPAVGGAIMAAIGLALPQTFGIGYPTLSAALLGQLSWPRMALLSAGKLAATVTSYGWGLSGGIFAPSLFIGATLGGSVAHLVHPFAGPSRRHRRVLRAGRHGGVLRRGDSRADHVDPDHLRDDRRLRDHPAADDQQRDQLHRRRAPASGADLRRAAAAGRCADARASDASGSARPDGRAGDADGSAPRASGRTDRRSRETARGQRARAHGSR